MALTLDWSIEENLSVTAALDGLTETSHHQRSSATMAYFEISRSNGLQEGDMTID